MSTRDIRKTLKRFYSVDVSLDLISRVTDGVLEELAAWQARPLDSIFPIVYIDGLVVKVRTNGHVINRCLSEPTDGRKDVLGVWLGDGGEGAKFWLSVLTELKNRGVTDVIFCCCDGLKGLPDAIEATWPLALVQTCLVHLSRASIRYCSWKDCKTITKALTPIYSAHSVEAASDARDAIVLGAFATHHRGSPRTASR